MLGKRFAYQFQGSGDEGWTPPWLRQERRGPHGRHHGHRHGPWGAEQEGRTPPWLRQERRGPRFFEMRRGRGPFGPQGPFGFGGDGPRFVGRGDMKFALLELLQERPMYGYEMMKALEEKSGGFYAPSPGSIYPTLQLLEDRSFVTAKEVEGKKVYTITDAGRALLTGRQNNEETFAGPPWMRHQGFGKHRFSPEMQALKSEAMEVVRLLTIAGRMSFQDPGQLTHLRSIIERTRKDLADMIYGASSQANSPSSTASNPSDGPSIDNV